VGKAKLLEGTANRYLIEIDIEAFLDDAPEVHASPAQTPSLAGSGPVSTIRLNSCFCSGDSLGTGPGALPLMSPCVWVTVAQTDPGRIPIPSAVENLAVVRAQAEGVRAQAERLQSFRFDGSPDSIYKKKCSPTPNPGKITSSNSPNSPDRSGYSPYAVRAMPGQKQRSLGLSWHPRWVDSLWLRT
jgi:hypothetical protein